MSELKVQKNSLKVNLIYNTLLQIVNFIIPLVTAPYISRTLGAESIGAYSYTVANTTYFLLIGSLGLALYGQIQVAACRDDKKRLSQLFWEIIAAKTLLFIVSVILFTLFIVIFGEKYLSLYIVQYISIFASAIDITWMLTGLEKFKQMVVRNIAVKIVSLLLIFTFVKSPPDVVKYAVVMQMAVLGGNFLLWKDIKGEVGKSEIKFEHIKDHLTRSMVYFVPGIISIIFTYSDKTVLGAVLESNYEVGIYEEACKVTALCGSVVNSIASVLLPRATYMYHNSSREDTDKFLKESFNGVCLVGTIMSFGIISIADIFVPFFLGEEFLGSVLILQILAVNVLFSAMANIFAHQGLIARGKQKAYNNALIVSAVLNVVGNVICVSYMKAVGVSLVSVLSSFILMVIILYKVRHDFDVLGLLFGCWRYFVAGIAMCAVSHFIRFQMEAVYLILTKVAICGMVYIALLYLLRDEFALKFLQNLLFVMNKKGRKQSDYK